MCVNVFSSPDEVQESSCCHPVVGVGVGVCVGVGVGVGVALTSLLIITPIPT